MANAELGITLNAKDNATAAIKDVGDSLGKLGSVAASVAAGGIALIGTALVSAGVAAFSLASDVDKATDQIGASLGKSTGDLAGYADTIKKVYGDNFGDSVADVGTAVQEVAKQLKLAGNDPALKALTEKAISLRDVFGVDLNKSVNSVKTLMDKFGISGDKAFGLITTGFQRGLDSSGDFLDTIGEYSTQFASGGATAQEFFNLLDNGLQGGVLGTDKAADAFKEFRLRIQDGSTLTRNALIDLGFDVDKVLGDLASGQRTVASVFDDVTDASGQTTDKTKQMNDGVALLGTQFEDLGTAGATGLGLFSHAFDDADKSTDTLNQKYTNLGSAMEGWKRQMQLALEPVGEALLGIANDALPAVTTAVTAMASAVGSTIDTLRTNWEDDWAGIRTTTENELSRMNLVQETFWFQWNRIFTDGSNQHKMDWETFMKNEMAGVTQLTNFYEDIILGFMKAIADAKQGIQHFFDDVRSWVNEFVATWNALVGAIGGTPLPTMHAPVSQYPTLSTPGTVNQLNMPSNSPSGIGPNLIGREIQQNHSASPPPGWVGAWTPGMTINVYGGDTQAVTDHITDAARSMGMRP